MKKPTSIKKTLVGYREHGNSTEATRNKPPRRDERRKARERKRWPSNTLATPCYPANVANLANAANGKHGCKNVPDMDCTVLASRGTIRTKAKAPALENVKSVEVATPTVKRGFVMPKISRHGFAHIGMVCGHGWGYPQGHPHGYGRVFNSHAHPLRLKTYRVVLYPVGAKTMQVNPLGHIAPVSKAVPAIPTTSTEAQAFALLQAVTSTNLAGFYLRRDNVAQARRKLRQALQALNALEVAHA